MKESLIYILEMLICSGIFALMHRLLIERRTSWRAERTYLMLSVVAAAVIPLLRLPLWPARTVYINVPLFEPESAIQISDVAEQVAYFPYEMVLLAIYILGVVVALVSMALELSRVSSLRGGATKERVGRTIIYTSAAVSSPFSLFRHIYLPEGLTEEEREMVLLHEGLHMRHHHSVEKSLMGVMRALLWFNPFVWMAHRSLNEVHEYEVDRDLLDSGVDLTEYRKLILKQLFGCNPDMASGLGNSLTKKRFIMMTKMKKIGMGSRLRAYAPIPVMALMVALFGCTQKNVAQAPNNLDEMVVVSYASIDETQSEQAGADSKLVLVDGNVVASLAAVDASTIKSVTLLTTGLEDYVARYGEKAANGVMVVTTHQGAANDDGGPSPEVEKAWEGKSFPQFEGGDVNNFYNWLKTQVRYPAQAIDDGITGKVMISFTVTTDGSLANVEVLQSPHNLLSEEVLRVLAISPKWIPAVDENGKKMDVNLVLPISFEQN